MNLNDQENIIEITEEETPASAKMNKYELMYIIDTAVEDEPRKELITRFTQLIVDNGGEVQKVDEWGKRRLAYAIDYKNEGYYVLVNFAATSAVPREVERNLQISDNILRYLVVKLEEKRSVVKPRPVPVRPAPIAPAAPVAEEAPVVAEPAPETTPAPQSEAPVEE